MDFFTVPTITFRVLYVLIVINHGRRMLLHVNVTFNPTARWVVRQLPEVFPGDVAPRYLIFDLDKAYSETGEASFGNNTLFYDNCHMIWQGYYCMAQVILDTIAKAKLLPASKRAKFSMEKLIQQNGWESLFTCEK